MISKIVQLLLIVVVVGILATTSPIEINDAEASTRHNCGCVYIAVEVWDEPSSENTTWGAIKVATPRIEYRRKCDIRWHWNPFYHKGACD